MKGIHLVVCVCLFLFVFNQFLFADKTMESDSLYTYKYINGIYMSEPERALNLLEGAESKKTLPLRIINELRSKAYRNMYMTKLAFVYARKSYLLDSISQKDPKHLLKMTVDLAELALLMSDHKESMRYALGGLKLAQKEKDKGAEGKLLFCIGENKWQLSFKEEAYDYFDKAIKQLQGAETKLEMAMLSYFYGMKMDYLLNDSRTEEALEVGLKREKLLKSIARLPEKNEAFLDLQYTYLYAKMSYICYLEGEYEQAEKYYQQYLSTKNAYTPDGQTYGIPYLLKSKQYRKVVDRCQDFKKLMQQQQDTVNLQYISILQKEVKAYLGLKDFEKVAALRESIISITDSVNSKDKQNAALELDAIYKATEQEEYIAEQTFQLRVRNISLAFLGCITFLTLFMLWRIWRHSTIVKYKNKMLAKFINEKLARKEDADELLIEEETEDPVVVPLDLEPDEESSEKIDLSLDEVSENHDEEEAENKKIFKDLNRIVVQDQLYLSPELSREDLAQIVHLNNARFARMIKENTGTNFNGYVNELRINYAIELLKRHPNYTIRAIADEAGFNSTPILYSMFKKKTGMTPYEFKKAQESLG
ncbi:helix-turn-helix domain-containing protein [Bacteroides faecis]|uniref:helix-turn-helix domain-containing protein n=1 Tax=Bacteroides faecis TaxID=674529 RepID=UPI00189852FA|nr:AraC family transcriptional regulator [Bacteroides faecis]